MLILYRLFQAGLQAIRQPDVPFQRCKLIVAYAFLAAFFISIVAAVLLYAPRPALTPPLLHSADASRGVAG